MCGICGIINTDSSVRIPIEVIKRMADTLIHRGPDEEGLAIEGSAAFGHRRLSIIDLSTGQQPLYNEDRTKVIVFNGEIYNFQPIRKRLVDKGHIFRTHSDTEVILHLYEEEGAKCVEHLRGMFAFAIYDLTSRTLFAARDRIGKKPFYYLADGRRFIFGSEIKAILAHGDISRDLDLQALADYLTYLYVPSPKSIFKAIRKLPPAHRLTLREGKVTVERYWDIQFEPVEEFSETQWIDKISAGITESVDMRLISEVPLGAFLSGGIDSSIVVGTMAGLQKHPVVTSSIGFEEEAFNELEYARRTAAHFKTEHHEQVVSIQYASLLDKLAWHYDEPFADSSALPTYCVSKIAREQVTVALSGDGGDETFAGYRRYYYDWLENRIRKILPGLVRKPLFSLLSALYPKADWLPQMFRAKTLLSNLSMDSDRGYYNSVIRFREPLLRRILNPDIWRELSGYSPFTVFKDHYDRAGSLNPLSRIQYVDMKMFLAEGILVKVDRASMAASLEVRAPLLDHNFMELAARISPALKLQGATGKYILRRFAEQLLPREVIDRRKMGFSIPVDEWFRKDLRRDVEEGVFAPQGACSRLLNIDTVRDMWRQHSSGVRNYGHHLWAILMLEKWAQKHLSNSR
jgi:asparagine synthase (glutamine-hydrolysing)